MAKVSLRIYNREIEALVDSGQLDEAIAHCRHILNTFPKHLETYRMLGKAYLEAKRYDEATDIFERVLMAVPDDFVAHVGMSIIRDEQNVMDAAIWHMQRAFEVQPSNTAIQSELQRLYGRRDGIEPPKIRLTRGALAHMYVQGELYPQAISEINGVLEEDPERQDMQVLLARAYFHAGRKSEAAEMCSQLLRRYPYCFDANRVLVELLPQTEQSENVQTYRKRINELNPYIAFVTGSVFYTEDVPDAAVSLEKLEWDGQPVDMGPEWGETKGIGLGEKPANDDEEPDWLKATAESTSEGLPIPTPSTGEEDEIPEFLRAAGWSEDSGTFQEGQGVFDDSDDSSDDLSLAEGDLPDWVKAMAPTGAGDEAESLQPESEEDLTQDDVPDWLQGLGDAQSMSSDDEPLAESELPDWLEAEKPVEDSTPEQEPQEETMAEPTNDDDIPDWLKAIQAEDEQAAPQESSQEPVQEIPQESMEESTELGDESLSDWQISDEDDTGLVDFDKTSADELGTSAQEQDDAIAWLEGLASKHGAKPEELVTDPNARTEVEPEWVQKAKATTEQVDAEEPAVQEQSPAETVTDLPGFLAQEQPSLEATESPSEVETPTSEEQPPVEASMDLPDFLAKKSDEPDEEPAENVDDLGTSAQEQDDAMAWLESLASKHGAKPEELVTDPEARKDTAPDWVQKAAEAGSEQTIGERPTAPPPEELEEFVESVLDEQKATEQEGEAPYAGPEAQPDESVPSIETDETGIWLQELAEEESAPVDQEPTTEAEGPAVEDDVPDWLREMEGDVSQAEATSESAAEMPLPDWLSNLDSSPSEPDAISAPLPEEAVSEPSPEAVDEIEINTATMEQLAGLPGIGDLLAQNIIAYRETYGDFTSLEDLSNVAGIGPSTIDELRGQVKVEEQPTITDWLKNVETESPEVETGEAVSDVTEEAVVDDLPSWLAGLDEEPEQSHPAAGDDDVPEWLRAEAGTSQPEPTAPTDWQPVESMPASEEMSAPEPEPEVKAEEPALESKPETEELSVENASTPIEEPPAQAAPPPAPEPESVPSPGRPAYQEPVTRSRTGMTGMLSSAQDPALTEAQNELTRGNISVAMEGYGKLIKKGKMLEEIIFDLREALYRYPVDVTIMQTLGDAYMRANRLQEALDSYTKAEELLR